VLPILTSGKVELLDNHRLIQQLAGLERRTARGGKDSIDHAPSGHDDLCNLELDGFCHGALRGTVGNLVCGAIVKPQEAGYGDQEGHVGRAFVGARSKG
jgi:hypothetical protein